MDDVPRPVAEQSLTDRARDWIAWFGLARLVTSAIAVSIVCVGAWLLVRAPTPPSEAALPAASQGTVPVATLPVPESAVSASSRSTSTRVVVHVAGAVAAPGVYELPDGSRLEAAIVAAGGALADAEVDALNLAAILSDGLRVYVPEVGEVDPAAATDPEGVATTSGPVDVNRATAGELETLPGVGPATATAIIAERERNGPFVSVEDLERVPGIGPAKLAGLIDSVTT